MSEQQATQEAPKIIEEDRGFREVLKGLVGKKVTVVNPESYEAKPMGHELRESYYPGKVSGWGEDYIIFHTVLNVSKKERQPVQQYIPLAKIKRLSMMNTGILLHL